MLALGPSDFSLASLTHLALGPFLTDEVLAIGKHTRLDGTGFSLASHTYFRLVAGFSMVSHSLRCVFGEAPAMQRVRGKRVLAANEVLARGERGAANESSRRTRSS